MVTIDSLPIGTCHPLSEGTISLPTLYDVRFSHNICVTGDRRQIVLGSRANGRPKMHRHRILGRMDQRRQVNSEHAMQHATPSRTAASNYQAELLSLQQAEPPDSGMQAAVGRLSWHACSRSQALDDIQNTKTMASLHCLPLSLVRTALGGTAAPCTAARTFSHLTSS